MTTSIASAAGSKQARVDGVPTVGVEEEFLLLRPDGEVACVAPEVLKSLAGDAYIKPEFMRFQVESTSSVCADLPTLVSDLVRERRALATTALAHGAHLVAAGTPHFGVPGVSAITDDPRYQRLREHFAGIAGDEVCCGCHVHVGVATRTLGVVVLARIRAWLPVLLALSGNSPMWRGGDSGWESYRYVVQTQWPTAIIPPRCIDTATYDVAVAERIAAGDALDPGSVYYFARLSPRYPTVEIRIADTCLSVAESVLIAGLCRALVMTAVADAHAERPYVDIPDRLVSASACAAARRGLDALLVDPQSGDLLPGRAVLGRLMAHLTPALETSGDRRVVAALLSHRLRRESGAARQRALKRRLSRAEFVRALADATQALDWPGLRRDPGAAV